MIYYHCRGSGFGMEKEDVKRQNATELSILTLNNYTHDLLLYKSLQGQRFRYGEGGSEAAGGDVENSQRLTENVCLRRRKRVGSICNL